MHYETHGDTDHSVSLESTFSTAGYILNSKKSSVVPHKVGMMLFIHDNDMVGAEHPTS